MGWEEACKETAKKDGLPLCNKLHCDEIPGDYVHKFCNCDLPSQPQCKPTRTSGCCPYGEGSVVPFFDEGVYCYCCCTCLAYGTPVAVATNDYKAVEQFLIGDMVLATGLDLQWKQAEVVFSSGTGAVSRDSLFIKATFMLGGKEDFILVTQSQVFLLPGGKLKRADRLVPGADQLVLADGGTTPLISLEIGRFGRGIHHIATSLVPTTDPNGHLLNAAGVVIGDYALQMGLRVEQPDELLVADHDALPVLGTKAYAERYSQLETTSFRAAVPQPGTESNPTVPDFVPLVANSRYIPADALSFVTPEQAWDIETRAPRLSPASNAGTDQIEYLFKVHRAFYPEVHFIYDFTSEQPNAWGFVENDVPFVIISAGLVRTDAVRFEAMAFIVAQVLSGIYGGPPVGDSGYSCIGQADYAAIVGVMTAVWRAKLYPQMLLPALAQIKELFSYIAAAHRGGLPGNTCMHISIDCRLEAMQAAMMSMPLPACAGGPKIDYLELNSASAEAIPGGANITLSFNEAVAKLSGSYAGNYKLTPDVTVDTATVGGTDPSKVVLAAQIMSDVEYTVDVSYVQSADGELLAPNKRSAKFVLKGA